VVDLISYKERNGNQSSKLYVTIVFGIK